MKPEIRHERIGQCKEHEVHSHPAFGNISMVRLPGGNDLFGTDTPNLGCMRITITKAEMHRDLSRDWHHQREGLISFDMSYSQFAQFITGAGIGSGTPVTLRSYRSGEYQTVPPITRHKTVREIHAQEITDMTQEVVADVAQCLKDLNQALEGGRPSMKDLRSVASKLEIAAGHLPARMKFMLDQAKEVLDKSVVEAEIEVQSYIDAHAKQLGLKHITDLALLDKSGAEE